MGVEVVIPPKLSNITTVGQFQQLVMLSESNSQMRKLVSGKGCRGLPCLVLLHALQPHFTPACSCPCCPVSLLACRPAGASAALLLPLLTAATGPC